MRTFLVTCVLLTSCTLFKAPDPLPDGVDPVRVHPAHEFRGDWDGYVEAAAEWWNGVIGCSVFEIVDRPDEADTIVGIGPCDTVMCTYQDDLIINIRKYRGLDVQSLDYLSFDKHGRRQYFQHRRAHPFPHVRVLVHGLGLAMGLEPTESGSIMNPDVNRQVLTVTGDNLDKARETYCSP